MPWVVEGFTVRYSIVEAGQEYGFHAYQERPDGWVVNGVVRRRELAVEVGEDHRWKAEVTMEGDMGGRCIGFGRDRYRAMKDVLEKMASGFDQGEVAADTIRARTL